MGEALVYNLASPNNTRSFETQTIKSLDVNYESPPFAQVVYIDPEPQDIATATPGQSLIDYDTGYDYLDAMFTRTVTHGSTTFEFAFTWVSMSVVTVTATRTAGSGTSAIKNQDGVTCEYSFGPPSFNGTSGAINVDRFIDDGAGVPGQWPGFGKNLREQNIYLTVTDSTTSDPDIVTPAMIYPQGRLSENAVEHTIELFPTLSDRTKLTLTSTGAYTLATSTSTELDIYMTSAASINAGWRNASIFSLDTSFLCVLGMVDSATAGSADVTFYVKGDAIASGVSDIEIYDQSDAYVTGIPGTTEGEATLTIAEGTYNVYWEQTGFYRMLIMELTVARGVNSTFHKFTLEDSGANTIVSVANEIPDGTYYLRYFYESLSESPSRFDFYTMLGDEITIGVENNACPITYPQDRRNEELEGLF